MIPLARPQIGSREEELVLDTLRSGRLALGPRLAEFEEAFGARVGSQQVSAVSSGTAGLHLAIRAAGIEPGDDVVTTPFSFVASANCLIYEGARPVFCDIDPRTLNMSVQAAADALTERTTGILPVHIFGYPADMPGIELLSQDCGLWIVEDACEALGAAHAGRHSRGRARQPERIRLLPEQAAHDGGGGRRRRPLGEPSRSESTPSATRAGRPTWAGSTTTGSASTTGSTTSRALSGSRSWSAWTRCWRRAPGSPRYTGRRSAGVEGLDLPCADRDGDRRGWFVYVVQLPREVDRDAAVTAMRERGVDTKPYLPAIHLLSFYRERFGHREGEFPVCEDVAARSLALPFFPDLAEGQVQQVVEALLAVIGRSA